MVNAPESWPMGEYKDVESNNYYNCVREKSNGNPAALARSKRALQHLARDHARLPMQWDGTPHAGFTVSDKPWMRVNDDYGDINVKKQTLNEKSILSFWKQVLKLRKEYADLLIHGAFKILDGDNEKVFLFAKIMMSQTIVVALNFTEENQSFEWGEMVRRKSFGYLTSNYNDELVGVLRPFEGRVYLANQT